MGMFKVKVTIANPQETSRSFSEDFWVDTGALYTFVPEDMLESIGLKPSMARDLLLADGRRDRRLLGFPLLSLCGHDEQIPCPVIFAPRGSLFLLGATALENFALEVDPATQTLKPILAIIGGFLGSAVAGVEVKGL